MKSSVEPVQAAFVALGDEVVAEQPRRPHPLRGDVAAGFQLVELRVDRRRRQGLRAGQVPVGDLGRVEPGRGRRHLFRERCGFLDPLVERHDGAQVARGGMFQEGSLQQRQALVAQRLLRQSEAGDGGADLQSKPARTPRSIAC